MFTYRGVNQLGLPDDEFTPYNYSGLRYMTPSDRTKAANMHSVNFYVKDEDGLDDDVYREINSYGDLHLIPSSMPFIIPPPVKLLTVDVPGSDTGEVDMSESLTGSPLYGVREGTIEFMYENTYRYASALHDGKEGPYIPSEHTIATHTAASLMSVPENVNTIPNDSHAPNSYTYVDLGPNATDPALDLPGSYQYDGYARPLTGCRYFYKDGSITPFRIYELLTKNLHGKRVRLVLMDFPDFYYEGRIWVEAMTPGQDSAGTVSIKYHFSPWRYQVIRHTINTADQGMVTYGKVPIFEPVLSSPGYVTIKTRKEHNERVKLL